MDGLEKVLLSWDEFGKLSKGFAENLKQRYGGEIDVVIGIAKGGLPLSVYIANSLDSRWDSIRIKSYTADAIRGEISLLYGPHMDLQGKTIMIVDDIIDEGKTMQYAVDYLNSKHGPKKIVTASLILKTHSAFKPDDYAQERNEWIVFPWEAEKE